MTSLSVPDEKLNTTFDVVKWCADNDIPADLVGRWVWVKFDAKPSTEVRTALKAAGFRWCKNRGEWAHNCGHPSRRGTGNPRNKYGEVRIDERVAKVIGGAA